MGRIINSKFNWRLNTTGDLPQWLATPKTQQKINDYISKSVISVDEIVGTNVNGDYRILAGNPRMYDSVISCVSIDNTLPIFLAYKVSQNLVGWLQVYEVKSQKELIALFEKYGVYEYWSLYGLDRQVYSYVHQALLRHNIFLPAVTSRGGLIGRVR